MKKAYYYFDWRSKCFPPNKIVLMTGKDMEFLSTYYHNGHKVCSQVCLTTLCDKALLLPFCISSEVFSSIFLYRIVFLRIFFFFFFLQICDCKCSVSSQFKSWQKSTLDFQLQEYLQNNVTTEELFWVWPKVHLALIVPFLSLKYEEQKNRVNICPGTSS